MKTSKGQTRMQKEDVSPEEINVSFSNLQPSLNPKIWTAEKKLKPEVKKALLKIAQAYFDTLEIEVKIKHKDCKLETVAAGDGRLLMEFEHERNS